MQKRRTKKKKQYVRLHHLFPYKADQDVVWPSSDEEIDFPEPIVIQHLTSQ